MTLLTMLLGCAVQAQATDPAQQAYEAGVVALKDKDPGAAEAELSRCVELAPERVDCRWELGWAYWLQEDWDAVVRTWEGVQRLDPDHAEAARWLPTARDNRDLLANVEGLATGPAPQAAADAALRLRAVGDVMLGTDFPAGVLPPNDGAQMLASVDDLLRDADLTFVNLEGPLCDGGTTNKCRPGSNCYAFRSPTRYGDHLAAAGVDLANTANNHAGDFGEFCRLETEKTLDALGIAYSGRPGTVASVESKGLKVAMIGFHTSRSSHYVNDHETAAELVRALDASHNIVIVSFHGGAEGTKASHVPQGSESFYGEDRGNLREFTHAVIDAGADLVLGHGPHVPRAMEVYNDRLIAYSLGNFATYGRFNLSGMLGVGLVLEVQLDGEGRFVTGQILPTRQVGEGVPEPDPDAKAVSAIAKLSREDFPSTGVVVHEDGTLSAP